MSAKPRKLSAVLSYRVATRRAFFSLLKHLSTRFRSRYSGRSTPTRFFRDFRMGMTGWMFRLRISSRILSASYPLSASIIGGIPEAEIVGRLAGRDVSSHRQTSGSHPEMDLSRDPPFSARSPPLGTLPCEAVDDGCQPRCCPLPGRRLCRREGSPEARQERSCSQSTPPGPVPIAPRASNAGTVDRHSTIT